MSKGRSSMALPPHPSAPAAFAEWFANFNRIIAVINACDIFTPLFQTCCEAIALLKVEILCELETNCDRRSSTVYDRQDYVVRELLRTNRLPIIINFARGISQKLSSGDLAIGPDGFLLLKGGKVDSFMASILLVELPSLLALLFTAQETVGIVSLDELLKFSREVLDCGIRSRLDFAVAVSEGQYTIFASAVFVLTSCMENLKVLNMSLFFTLFKELKLFPLLVRTALKAGQNGQTFLLDKTIECMNTYIQSSQSEPDRKSLAADQEFGVLYKQFIQTIVESKLQEDRANRSKFRAILFFSRSIRGAPSSVSSSVSSTGSQSVRSDASRGMSVSDDF
jgi:hypothetical protein